MKKYIFLILPLLIVLVACNKEQEPIPSVDIPEGSTPFSDDDILFVPYTSESPFFKDQFGNELTLNFSVRKRTEEYYAWDQTYFTFSTDANLELEMRLRYLQSDVSKKTLAMYMPYTDNNGILRTNVFEMPIDPVGLEESFFENIIDFHDTLVIDGVNRYGVFEVNELVNTNENQDGPKNFTKIFYNRTIGILKMSQNDGVVWVLQ